MCFENKGSFTVAFISDNNTFGIHAVNQKTFNIASDHKSFDPSFEKFSTYRRFALAALRVHNATLNILGYLPIISTISGCVRMATGLATVSLAAVVRIWIKVSNSKGELSSYVKNETFVNEALTTGVAQMTRGFFEAIVPGGWVINASLDIIGSVVHFPDYIMELVGCEPEELDINDEYREDLHPHKDWKYPFPAGALKLLA